MQEHELAFLVDLRVFIIGRGRRKERMRRDLVAGHGMLDYGEVTRSNKSRGYFGEKIRDRACC